MKTVIQENRFQRISVGKKYYWLMLNRLQQLVDATAKMTLVLYLDVLIRSNFLIDYLQELKDLDKIIKITTKRS